MYSVTNQIAGNTLGSVLNNAISASAEMYPIANFANVFQRPISIAKSTNTKNIALGCRIDAQALSLEHSISLKLDRLVQALNWLKTIMLMTLSSKCLSGFAFAERQFNGKQQDANRCIPPGRNPCGGNARKPNRRI